MNEPVASLIGDGTRLHLQHGPIDLIIGADSTLVTGRQSAFEAAVTRFDTVLTELVSELPLLRSQVLARSKTPNGVIARRMDTAVRAHASNVFVTRMAAVAGAVADEVLSAMVCSTKLTRAYVNNGGDIALHLTPGQSFSAAIAGLDNTSLGKIDIPFESGIKGIATSGQRGRSLSMGIADSVTVLGTTAASADVAATLIANAVDLPNHPQIKRRAANLLQDDNDLGNREVVTYVGQLSETEIDRALNAGAKTANKMLNTKNIIAASLTLGGQPQLVGNVANPLPIKLKEVENV